MKSVTADLQPPDEASNASIVEGHKDCSIAITRRNRSNKHYCGHDWSNIEFVREISASKARWAAFRRASFRAVFFRNVKANRLADRWFAFKIVHFSERNSASWSCKNILNLFRRSNVRDRNSEIGDFCSSDPRIVRILGLRSRRNLFYDSDR